MDDDVWATCTGGNDNGDNSDYYDDDSASAEIGQRRRRSMCVASSVLYARVIIQSRSGPSIRRRVRDRPAGASNRV